MVDTMVIKESAEAVTATVTAMSSSPLAIALLLVNIGFLCFAAYILGEVATNAQERNKTQMDLILKLVTDIRDCRQGPKTQGG
jgi:hypothetical protein